MIGLYYPGSSVLHRLPAGVKLAAMLVGIIVLVAVVRSPIGVGVAGVIAALGFVVARIPVSVVIAQLRPLLWMVAIIAVFQILITGPARAVVVCGVLVLSVALAALVTLTTTVTAMLDTSQRALGPLRRFGVDPERVGLLLALTIRCVPLLSGIVREVAEARKARGLQWSITALATPVIVRALRTADALGEALVARGADD
ncbi:energy-coupling factor transporter transmembrane component T family protein [Antrihabitans cavernicola]|uniref:Energy-coupling factor transporter transmembrane protein EcfT n=1 Tax=Antrihabitans cavernicola TaxID=2495913 RepID=A0A5A7SCN8_9NOCA|nr:energy-coupling factor transporter transmembrane protein EcfT [Spelaeibacter cavernicola]KAA0023920.1 energy-coupling factor transporter transmembrane protein EcfT [Spelaeibacter cavernicola]